MPPKKQDDAKKSVITEKNPTKEAPKPKEKREQTSRSVKEPQKNTNEKPIVTETKNNNNNSNEKNAPQTPQKDPPFIHPEDRALLTSLQTKMDSLHSQLDSIKTQLIKCEELTRHLKDARKVERGNLIGSQKTIERFQNYKDDAFHKAEHIKRHHNVKMAAVKTAEQLVMARWNLKQPFERSNRDHNLSRLQAKIQQLQKEFENKQLSLSEEKRHVAEIDGVHQLVVLVTDFHEKWKEVNVSDQKEIQRLEENVKKLSLDIDEEKKIEQEYQTRVDNLTKKIDEVRQRIDSQQNEKTTIQEQIQETNNQREAVRTKIDKQKAEWVAQRELERKRQEELRIKRQQEKEKQEKRRELLRQIKEAKTPPFQEDVSLCDRLLNFLQQLEKEHSKPVKAAKQGKKQPKEQKNKQQEQKEQKDKEEQIQPEQQIEKEEPKETEEQKQTEQQPEKEATNDNTTAETPQPEPEAPEAEPTPKDDSKPIELEMEVILSLEQLSLKIPFVLGELRACCEQLKEKKLREAIPPLPITDDMKALIEEMEKEKLEKKQKQKDGEKTQVAAATDKPQLEQPQETPTQEQEAEKEQSEKVEQVKEQEQPALQDQPAKLSESGNAAAPEIEESAELVPEENKEFKRPETEEQTQEATVVTDAVPSSEL